MSRVCDASGKKVTTGGMRKHNRGKAGGISGPWAFKATRKTRKWIPNLRKTRVLVDNVPTNITISMKYYKKLKQVGRIWLESSGKYAFVM